MRVYGGCDRLAQGGDGRGGLLCVMREHALADGHTLTPEWLESNMQKAASNWASVESAIPDESSAIAMTNSSASTSPRPCVSKRRHLQIDSNKTCQLLKGAAMGQREQGSALTDSHLLKGMAKGSRAIKAARSQIVEEGLIDLREYLSQSILLHHLLFVLHLVLSSAIIVI